MEPIIFFVVPISFQDFILYLRKFKVFLGFSQQVVQVDNGSSLLAGPAEDVVKKRPCPKQRKTTHHDFITGPEDKGGEKEILVFLDIRVTFFK